jgi:hypothetical protein
MKGKLRIERRKKKASLEGTTRKGKLKEVGSNRRQSNFGTTEPKDATSSSSSEAEAYLCNDEGER